MKKISVIVPVYNVDKYLEKCLKSLVNQTLKNMEVIVVNDGSPDNSQKIINRYQKMYPQIIKTYIKPNGGVSDARNFGIDKATGDYIGFVDGDDYVEVNMYEKLYYKALEKNFDVVVCDLNLVNENNDKVVYKSSNYKNDLLNKNDIKKTYINAYPVIWNKIYKRELFKKVKFKLHVWHEDVEFLYKLFPILNNIGFIKEPLINYVQRENSSTKTFDDRLYDYIDNWNGIIDFYKENNLYDNYKKELEYCYVRYLYATLIKRASNYPSKEKFYEVIDKVIKNIKNNFPKYRRNSYFYKSFKGFYLLLFNKSLVKILFRK